MTPSSYLRLMLLAAAVYVVSPVVALASFVTFSVGGNDSTASIQSTVDSFRFGLGNPSNGNAAGPLLGGRREINWDGGGVATSLAGTPFSGFQDNRGALFTTPGTGFVQAPPTGLTTTFGNPTYTTSFGVPFSPSRLFTPLGSNITDVTFFVPGSAGSVQATVGGFGAVFSDVNFVNSSSLQFFDLNNNLLFLQNVAPATVADGGLSFLGAIANAGEQIFRVRITTGNTALGPNDGGGVDVVVLDDVLYREPQSVLSASVPEGGSTVALLTGALVIVGTIRRRFC